MQVLCFSRQNLQTFDITRLSIPLTIAKLSTFKNGPVFLANPVLDGRVLPYFVTITAYFFVQEPRYL